MDTGERACTVPLLFSPSLGAGEEEVMEGERRYKDGIAAEVCTKREGAAAQERGEKEGRSRCSVGSQRSLSDIPVAHFVPVWQMHKAAM